MSARSLVRVMFRALLCGLLCTLLCVPLAACQPEVPASSGRLGSADAVRALDSGGGASNDATVAAWDAWPSSGAAPVVTVTTQPAGTTQQAIAIVTGTLTDDIGVAAATLQVGVNVPTPLAFNPTTGAFSVEVLLPFGAHTLTVRAWDIGGTQGQAAAQLRRVGAPLDHSAPKLTVATPSAGFAVSGNTVWVVGQASDDVAVTDVTVQIGAAPPVRAETSDFFGHWQLVAVIGAGGQVKLTVRATDAAGHTTAHTLVGKTTLQIDTVPPTLHVTAPLDNAKTDTGAALLQGTAFDASGIAAVQVRVGSGPYLAAQTSDGFKSFSLPLTLQPGPNLISVRARDGAGLVTTQVLTVQETSGSQWSLPITVPLRLQPKQTAPLTFNLDRAGLAALLPSAKAAQIVAIKIGVTQLISATLDQIRNACGSGWQKPNNLAKNCPPDWGQAEINLWRLVTMTPANVNVAGTSIEGMSGIAKSLSQWGLMDNFSEILAITLGITPTSLIVPATAVADSMVANVVGSHPNATPSGEIIVTLEDCLSDLKTLTKRYGKSGTHPGFLDPKSPPTSKILTDEFAMTMAATSNLRWHDALRLGKGKGYLALIRDTKGPTYHDVLEFDFLNPKMFAIDGLAPAAKVNLAFRVQESPQWLDIGTSMLPLPRGNSKAWALPKWTLEYALIDAAYRGYKNRRGGCDFCSGKKQGALLWEVPLLGLDEAELVVGRQGYAKFGSTPTNFKKISPNPAGWLRIWTLFGLGKPPKPQYVWDMLLGVSQRRLLDGGVKQGQGSVRFVLKQVPIGLTAQDLEDALAPSLHSQRAKLAQVLMGDWQSKQPVDVFLAAGVQGKPWLMFVTSDDPLPAGTAKHVNPGFFADVKLTKKLSSTASQGSGDGAHEKLAWPAATQTVYCADVKGTVHRLRLDPQPDGTLWVTMRRWIGATVP